MADIFEIVGRISLEGADRAERDILNVTGTAQQSSGIFGSVGTKIAGAIAGAFATQKIIAFGKDVISTTQTFSDSMLKVQSLSGASGEELQKLNDTALQYGSTTAWTSSQVADAMGYMALAGFDTNQILSATPGILGLASASGTDLARASDILTDALTAFGYEAKDASLFADVLATTQAKSNTTVDALGEAFKYAGTVAGTYKYRVEDVSTALGLMANAGVKGTMAGTAFSSIISRLGTNTSHARDTLEELGIAFFNSDGTARDLSSVMMELADATANMSVEQKSNIAKTIAGMEAQKGLLAILNQGSDGWKNLQSSIENCAGSASDMSNTMESGIGGAIRTMQSALEGFKIKLGQKFEPYIAEALQNVAKFVTGTLVPTMDKLFKQLDNVTKFAKEHKGLIEGIISLLEILTASMISFKVGAMIQGVVQMWQTAQVTLSLYTLTTEGATIAQGFLNGELTLGEVLVGLFTGQVTLAEVATALWAKAQAVLNAVMSANPIALVVMAIGALIAIFVVAYNKSETFRNFVNKLWENLKEFGAWVADGFVKAWDGVVKFFKETLPNAFNKVVDFVKNNWQELLELLVNPFGGALKLLYKNCDGFRELVNNLGESIKKAFNATIEWFKQLPDKIAYYLGYALGKVAKWSIDLVLNAKKAGKEFIDNIVKFFKELPGNVMKFCIETGTKISNWFKNTIESAKNWGSNFVKTGKESVKTFVENVGKFIKNLPKTIKEWLSKALKAVKEWAEELVENAKQAGKDFFDGIVEWFKNLPNKIKEIGKNLIDGLWNGIKSSIKNFNKKISDFCKNVLKGFKDGFGIKSPSRLTAELGRYLTQGLGVGIEEDDSAEKSIKNKVDDVLGIANGATANIKVGASVDDIVSETPMQKYQVDFNAQFTSLSNSFDNLLAIVSEYLPNIANGVDKDIVIDGNSLAVGISRNIDRQLGKMATAKGRGNV